MLCKAYGTSERTIRRVVELLEADGFLRIEPRKRPVVVSAFPMPADRALQHTKKADAAQVNDLMETAELFCYPIYLRGLRLCTGADWRTPEQMLSRMDPGRPAEFWQLCSRLGRFFIARNGNELLLRAVDSLGFRGKELPLGSLENRAAYYAHLETMIGTVKRGGAPAQEDLDAIFSRYRVIAEQSGETQFLRAGSACPMLAQAEGVGLRLSLAQERYSSIALDLLGLIAMGRYQPGDRLPTHDQIQREYRVSRDTSVKAVRMLQAWGVVQAAPRRGILVEMDLDALQRIQIAPETIARHVRRYLDSLDLLALTVEPVAAHAAAYMEAEAVRRLRNTIVRQEAQPYAHQLIPRTLLDFITEHIPYHALQSIYAVLTRNLSIGRSIPKLVSRDKNPQNSALYRQCLAAVDTLIDGEPAGFAAAAGALFAQVQSLVAAECKRLGYWDAAMGVYDGAALWQ